MAGNSEVASTKTEAVSVEPEVVTFYAPSDQDQVSVHTVTNQGQTPIAIKLKTSNNKRFQVNSVFGVIQPGKSTTLKVYQRKSEATSTTTFTERVGIWYCEVPAEVTDVKAVWKVEPENTKKKILRVKIVSLPMPPPQGADDVAKVSPPPPPAAASEKSLDEAAARIKSDRASASSDLQMFYPESTDESKQVQKEADKPTSTMSGKSDADAEGENAPSQ